MAAIFMRNRYVGWAAFVYSVQSWLGESEDSKKNSSTPGYFSVGMSRTYTPQYQKPERWGVAGDRDVFVGEKLIEGATAVMSLLVTYLPLFLPPPPTAGGTATEAFPPAPLA